MNSGGSSDGPSASNCRPRTQLPAPKPQGHDQVLVHSGARLPPRVWPLENYRALVRHLRESGRSVQVACDPGPARLVAKRRRDVRGHSAHHCGAVLPCRPGGNIHRQ